MTIFSTCWINLFFAVATINTNFEKSSWQFVGPFPIGKTEIDADPLESYHHIISNRNEPCSRFLILRRRKGCPTKFLSEVALKGYVGWNKLQAQFDSVSIQLPLPKAKVDYNNLIQGLNKMTIIEMQGWVTKTIEVYEEGYYEFKTLAIHSFFIDTHLYAVNITSI